MFSVSPQVKFRCLCFQKFSSTSPQGYTFMMILLFDMSAEFEISRNFYLLISCAYISLTKSCMSICPGSLRNTVFILVCCNRIFQDSIILKVNTVYLATCSDFLPQKNQVNNNKHNFCL